MELTISGLISGVIALVGIISYLTQFKPRMDSLEKNNEQLWEVVQAHKENESIHFNEKVTKQVDEKYNQRFQTIENTLGKLDEKIEKKFDSLNTKLDKVLEKK